MITYGFSIQGKSHIKNDIVCQDSNKTSRLKSGHYIGIVADGVGSAPYSDVGSKTAVDCLFEYCNTHITKNTTDLQQILKEGYEYAFSQIEKIADEKEDNIADYDTTLSVALYKNKKVVYGHAGDGGIIVKCKDGIIKPITTRQKGADGASVMPLRAGEKSWKFGACEDEVVAVILLTDGMLDGVIQPVLVNLPPNLMAMAKGDFKKDNVYVTASEFFMNPYAVYQNKSVKKPEQIMEHFINGDLLKKDEDTFFSCIKNAYVNMLGKNNGKKASETIKKYFYAVWALKNVTDDKTVVCLIDDKEKVKPQKINYYLEPDWNEKQKKYNELLYGKETDSTESEESDLTEDENEVQDDKTVSHRKEKNEKTTLNIKFISTVAGIILILLLISFSIGIFIGRGSKKNTKQAEVSTTQLSTVTETYARADEIKVENKVNKFMDNLSQIDKELSTESKLEFQNQVNINGFKEIIKTIKNYNLNRQNIEDKKYNRDFQNKEPGKAGGNSFETTAESISDYLPETTSDDGSMESTVVQEPDISVVTQEPDVSTTSENNGETTNISDRIVRIEKIMENVKQNNDIELFKEKVVEYLNDSDNSEKIKLIKQNLNMLYSE